MASKLTIKELKELATKNKLSFASKIKKQELLELLKNNKIELPEKKVYAMRYEIAFDIFIEIF